MKEKNKMFLINNWFKVGILIGLLIIASSISRNMGSEEADLGKQWYFEQKDKCRQDGWVYYNKEIQEDGWRNDVIYMEPEFNFTENGDCLVWIKRINEEPLNRNLNKRTEVDQYIKNLTSNKTLIMSSFMIYIDERGVQDLYLMTEDFPDLVSIEEFERQKQILFSQ